MTVTANDGIPNPWGFGTFINSANVLNSFDLVEHEHTDDGKGSGVEQTTYTYTRSYALGICRAIRNEDGTYSDIAGVLRATHNGKVVYNVQPDATPEQQANNSKFLENHKFYLGGETQLPDPTLESYLGVSNASAYRGQVYMAATDEDQTQSNGSLGTWEFVVAMVGEVNPTEDLLAAGRVGDFLNSSFPLGDSESSFTLYGHMMTAAGTYVSFAGDTIAEIKEHFQNYLGGNREFNTLLGYSSAEFVTDISAVYSFSGNVPQPDVTDLTTLYLVYGDHDFLEINSDPFNDANCTIIGLNENGVYTVGGHMLTRVPSEDTVNGYIPASNACGDDTYCVLLPALYVEAQRNKRIAPRSGAPAGSLPIPDVPGYYLMPDGTVVLGVTYTPVIGTYLVLSVISSTTIIDGLSHYTYYEHGPALEFGDPNYENEAFWTGAYDAAVLAGTLPSGWTYGVEYPNSETTVWQGNSPDSEIITIEGVPLGTIVAEVCRRCGLTDDDIDVSQLTDIVHGFKVATESTGDSIISALMLAYFFDFFEADDQLHAIKRGGNAVFEITPDDVLESDGPVIEETEIQEVELLRKVHVRSMDPAAGYVETTQTAERRAKTVAADGEQTVQIPIVLSADEQAQIAEKRMKVAWSETRRFKFMLPYTRPELTPTDVGTITDRNGRTQRIRLMEMTEEAGRIDVTEAMLDRQSAYTSNVQGVFHKPPTDTSPGLIGPTFGVPMNLPSLRTADNTPGAYIAACGYLPGWRACSVLLSVDGGASFANVMTITQPSRMGVLTDDVSPSPADPIDVFMRNGQISTITDDQIAARGNAWAITSDFATTDAVSEVGQSKTAELQSGGIYELTDNVRGGLATTPVNHFDGDPFVMLSSVYFLPLDISLAGSILYFKFVSFGTSPDYAEEIPFVFRPQFTSVVIEPYTDDADNIYTDDANNTYYYETTA